MGDPWISPKTPWETHIGGDPWVMHDQPVVDPWATILLLWEIHGWPMANQWVTHGLPKCDP